MSTKYKRTVDPWRVVASFALSSILAIGPVAAPISAFASELDNVTTEEVVVDTEADEQNVTTDTEIVDETQAIETQATDDTTVEVASDGEEAAAENETTLTTQNNGVLQPTTYYNNFGEIWLYNENAIDPGQMESAYWEEFYNKTYATYEQYQAAEKECKQKILSYRNSVSRLAYSSWNIDKYIAYRNAQNARWGESPLTSKEIEDIRNGETAAIHKAQTISGVSYNKAKNTLTIKNVNTNDVLHVRNLGNDFKINVSGVNKLGGIIIDDREFTTSWNPSTGETKTSDDHWGAGLSLTGTGSLMVNQSKNQDQAIYISSSKTAARLIVGANVSLRLFSNGSTGAATIYGTTSGNWKNAFTLKGKVVTTNVKYADTDVAYPLYRSGRSCYYAESAKEGVAALDPNDGYYGSYVMCADKKHVAVVSKSHKDQKTGKYVADEWKVYEATVTEYPNGLTYTEKDEDGDSWTVTYEPGGYKVEINDSKKPVRVKDNNGAPAGYSLIKLGTQQAVHSYAIANTEFEQLGKKIIVGKATYVLKKDGTVWLKKAPNKKTVTVPATIKVNGKKLSVTGISPKAFKSAKKCKTIKIKTKKLTKKSVKNALKGAKKVKTVKVPKKKKAAYAQYFAKGNSGKAVTVK